ncbi:putative lipoprotein with Yx(FWY)xxD motif [Streptomyces sp. 3330]|uniref:hypothetical protein n=1 Tax=Streptomyces sp. 3330 TaxID=2817755 RepID=UPI00285E84D2|nr:hypothetical protein [Streptomyces sp. 3330]MDR6980885.1 putative lipoprotein with Yx(FWY)xxD motif [Streptomyces sp. 3330]
MYRTRIATVAATLMAGTLLLTACGGGDEQAAKNSETSVAADEVNFKDGTAKQNKADLSTGDFAANAAPAKKQSSPVIRNWVQLSAASAGDLDPVVTNAAGFVLYRFDKDTPGKSNCFDACEQTWPPYLVKPGGKVFIDGIKKSDVGFIRRSKGFQLTLGKAPLYLFSKDLQPGDTNGQGVGGTWFGVTPDGKRSGEDGGEVAEPEIEESGNGGATGGNGSAGGETKGTKLVARSQDGLYKFADDPNDSESAVGTVSGRGCKNTSLGGAISSISPDDDQSVGKPIKLWDGPDCTGKSLLLESGVSANLAAQNFDNKTRSVFIGEFATGTQ